MKKTLSILLVTVATLTMAACGNTTTEKATTQSRAETSQKVSAETTYPLTVKTYDAKGNEVEQVFDKAPEKV
ncbi:MAG: metal ABC transporter substrate-binding protein, partial [Streptococcus mitis]|nr:metal ABC transporter substrate-binding protein [Streptococcus mitis]